ncbi:MAG: FIST N-terminal domain-containing protein [Steroidobacteraceae bacterium]
MTEAITAFTSELDSARAGHELGARIRAAFDGKAAHALIVFASAQHRYHDLLCALADTCGTEVIVGSSSAGEFTESAQGVGGISVMAFRSDRMSFSVGLGRNISEDAATAARDVAAMFTHDRAKALPYHAALVMTDALAGNADTVIEELTIATGGNYKFFGGGAGDDGRFQSTHVFAGRVAAANAVVALQIRSVHPIGVGVSHGWVPGSASLRVTEADGMKLISLNGAPAVEAFEEYAHSSGQSWNRDDPLPFFFNNIIGIKQADNYRLRVPLGVNEDGSVACAAPVPSGSVVHIMKTTARSATLAAEQATRHALEGIQGQKPAAAVVFDCVATRLRLGNEFATELQACAAMLDPVKFIGCNTYGQIARAEGQFGGFHNCTAVVCVFPD